MLRRFLLSLLLACSFLPIAAAAAVDEQTEVSLYSAIRGIEYYVNKKYVDALVQGLSTSARPGLEEELRSSMPSGDLSLLHTSWEFSELPNGHYRADTRTTVQVNEGTYRWNTTGFGVFYELESTNQGWVIVDTNLAEVISGDRAQTIIRKVMPLVAAALFVGLCVFVYLLFIRPKRVASVAPVSEKNP